MTMKHLLLIFQRTRNDSSMQDQKLRSKHLETLQCERDVISYEFAIRKS